MSDLTRFRDHCRKQAEKCEAYKVGAGGLMPLEETASLWRMLADEVDAYLAAPPVPTDADHDSLVG